jgi:adenylate cyclase
MTSLHENRRNAIVAALGAWVICAGLTFLPLWQVLEERSFDVLSLVTGPGKSQLPITIVGIDEASFTQLGLRWPWPRDVHAKVIERLAQSGAAVIALDLMFPEPSAKAEEDQAMAAAIARAGNVVLAADHDYHETSGTRQWLRMDPIIPFTQAGATTGLASMPLGGDGVARHFSSYPDAFWRESVRTLLRTRPGVAQEPYLAPGSLIRHLGPRHTFPYVSYYQVLNGDPNIPRDFFADQIVLIGRDVRASPEVGSAQGDNFATPYLLTSKLLTPGVELQATMIENALMGQAIQAAGPLANLAALSVLLALALPALIFWHPVRSTAIIVPLGLVAVGLSAWSFEALRLWFATLTPLLGLALATGSTSAASFLGERRRAQAIRSAFALYVSGDVVDQMIAHPERLRLGGERREMTLLFSDLAGFTSFSERLPPDGVANVINAYLNGMTHVIMDRGGTVDKFIGDAVMAFWGAPLADPEHAKHALDAAVAMQEELERLQPEFARLGAGRLGLRIGLHSGMVVVGNMGSSRRFDYTALGDTVNFASRLEGVNKAYGTGILLSAETAKRLDPGAGLRRVDRVRVKGKQVPMDIYTPCADAALAAASEEAWQAYAAMDWSRAAGLWSKIRATAPEDPVAAVFIERIEEYRAEPPPEGWDGSIALEKL